MNNNSFTARSIAESGLMAALTVMLMIVSIYVPLIGFIAVMVMSVPLMIIVVKHGLKNGVLASFVILILANMILGLFSGVVAAIPVIILGLAYGYCFYKHISPGKSLLIGTLACGIAGFILVMISSLTGDIHLGSILTQMETFLDDAVVMYQQQGLVQNGMIGGVSVDQFKQIYLDSMRTFLPGSFVAAMMFWATVNYLVAQKILLRLNFGIAKLPKFREWNLPFYLIWGVILGLGFYVIGAYFDITLCVTIAKNILYVYYPLFLISGISLLTYFLNVWKFTGLMKVSVFLLLLVFPFMSLVFIVLMGLFDTVFDFRAKLRKI